MVLRFNSDQLKTTSQTDMTSPINLIEHRQNDILNCVKNMEDILFPIQSPIIFELQKITMLAHDVIRITTAYCENIRHMRRERRSKRKINKRIKKLFL